MQSCEHMSRKWVPKVVNIHPMGSNNTCGSIEAIMIHVNFFLAHYMIRAVNVV